MSGHDLHQGRPRPGSGQSAVVRHRDRSRHRDALFLIDLQEAFFESEQLQGARPELVAAIDRLTAAAHAAGVPAFLITTEHSRDRSTWTLTMLDDGRGFLFHGDETTRAIDELDTEGLTRIEKARDSAFFGTDLLLRLGNLGVDTVLLAGVSTHACIAQTARDAFANNVRAQVITDAIAEDRPEHHASVLQLLVDDRQVGTTTVDEVTEHWQGAVRADEA